MPSLTASTLILAIVVLIVVHTVHLMELKRWSAFDPLNAFWGGVFVVYVIQPLTYGALYEKWHAPGVMEWTCFWILFAMCFVVAGYESHFGRNLARKVPATPARLHPLRMQWVAYITIVTGLLGYMYEFASAGGFENWAATGRGGTDWQNASVYIAQLAELLPLGITILLFEVEMHITTPGKRLLAWSLGGAMLLWFFYLGSRSHTIAFSWVLLAAYYVPRRRNPSKVVLGFCAVGLLIAAEFLGQYREQFTNLSFNIEEQDFSTIEHNVLPLWLGGEPSPEKLAAQRGAEFNCVMAAVEVVPDIVPYNKGVALLELATRMIPREFWPEKRYPSLEYTSAMMENGGIPGTPVQTAAGAFLAGPAFTFVGYWYGIGGGLALALAGFFTGVMFRLIRCFYDRSRGEADAILYVVLAPLVGFNEAAATPLFFIFSFPYTLVPVLIFFRMCRARPRPRGAVRGAAARAFPVVVAR